MALHSAQGPRLGVPQMISSRAQFGVYGAALPLVLVIVIVMYLGFAATGTVLSGQAISRMIGTDVPAAGICLFGVVTALIATFGYHWTHRLGRVATTTGTLGFTLTGTYRFRSSHRRCTPGRSRRHSGASTSRGSSASS